MNTATTKFFKRDIIREYAKRITPILNKNDVSILHRNQIEDFVLSFDIAERLSRKTKIPKKLEIYEIENKKSNVLERPEKIDIFSSERSKEVIRSCINKCPNIGSLYVENSLHRSLDDAFPDYDIVLLIDNKKRVAKIKRKLDITNKKNNPTKNNKTMKQNRFTPFELNEKEVEETARKSGEEAASRILGILIVQKGECTTRPNTVSIKLICASSIDDPESRQAKKLGSILLGLYLYSLKKNIENGEYIDHIGLLELSNSYKNLPGYCAYSKFGFIEDNSPDIGATCYKSAGLLPMYVNVDTLDYDKIVDIVNETGKISANPHKLCSEQFRNLDGTIKEIVIELYENLDYLHTIIEEKRDKSFVNQRTEPYMPPRNFYTMKRIINSLENGKNLLPEKRKEIVDIKSKLIDNEKDTFMAFSIDELKCLCNYNYSVIVSVLSKQKTKSPEIVVVKSKSKSPEKMDEVRPASIPMKPVASIPMKPVDAVPKKKLYDRLKSIFSRRKKSPDINAAPKQKMYDRLKGLFTRKNKSTEKVQKPP